MCDGFGRIETMMVMMKDERCLAISSLGQEAQAEERGRRPGLSGLFDFLSLMLTIIQRLGPYDDVPQLLLLRLVALFRVGREPATHRAGERT